MSTRTPSGQGEIRRIVLSLSAAMLLPFFVQLALAQQLAPAAQPPTMQPPAAMPGAAPPPPRAAARAAPVPATPPPVTAVPMPPAMAAPPNQTAALPTGTGLCQCIADRNKLDFTCPGSVEACQSSCGTL
jgi:hypothetical protein